MQQANLRTYRPVQSVDRALTLLEILAVEGVALSLQELSRRLDLPVQTIQGLLRTLEMHNLITQDGRGAPYGVGEGLSRLRKQCGSRQQRGILVESTVRALSEELQESILLAEWSGRHVVGVVNIQYNQALTVSGNCEVFSLLHTMSTGKLLLAHLPPGRLVTLLATLELPPRTPHTITDRDQFREHLAEVRERGYAENINESEIGVAATAVPVRSVDGTVLAALGVCLPLVRYEASRRVVLRDALLRAADRIGELWATSAKAGHS